MSQEEGVRKKPVIRVGLCWVIRWGKEMEVHCRLSADRKQNNSMI